MAKSTLPALHGDDRGTGCDDIQCKSIAESESNSIVHLPKLSAADNDDVTIFNLHRSAIGGFQRP